MVPLLYSSYQTSIDFYLILFFFLLIFFSAKLAKDIFSKEDSDEDKDDETTARVVAKLIDGLGSGGEDEVESPCKKMRRNSSKEEDKLRHPDWSLADSETNFQQNELRVLRKSPQHNIIFPGSPENSKSPRNLNLSHQSPRTSSLSLKSPQNSKSPRTFHLSLAKSPQVSKSPRSSNLSLKSPQISRSPGPNSNCFFNQSSYRKNLKSPLARSFGMDSPPSKSQRQNIFFNSNSPLSRTPRSPPMRNPFLSPSPHRVNCRSNGLSLDRSPSRPTELKLSARHQHSIERPCQSHLFSPQSPSCRRISSKISNMSNNSNTMLEAEDKKSPIDHLCPHKYRSESIVTTASNYDSTNKPDCSRKMLAMVNKGKKTLFSTDSFVAPETLLEETKSKELTLAVSSKARRKKQADKSAEEVAFLYKFCKDKEHEEKKPPKKETTTNRRRSARLNPMSNIIVDSPISNKNISHGNKKSTRRPSSFFKPMPRSNEEDCAEIQPSGSHSNKSVNCSMSVMYGADDSPLPLFNCSSTSKEASVRRSIDEFSFRKKGGGRISRVQTLKELKNTNQRQRASLPISLNSHVDDDDSQDTDILEEENNTTSSSKAAKCTSKGKRQSTAPKKAKEVKSSPGDSKTRTSSTSEEESVPHRLRHANSLIMEMALNPRLKRLGLALVMTSLHKQ